VLTRARELACGRVLLEESVMIRFHTSDFMRRMWLIFSLSTILTIAMAQGGCRKNPDKELKASGHAFTVGQLKEVVAMSDNPVAQERAKSALSLLSNRVEDTTPVVILAGLGVDDSGEILL